MVRFCCSRESTPKFLREVVLWAVSRFLQFRSCRKLSSPVGVRIRNEYPHVAATRCFHLRVFKPVPEGGMALAISDAPATASAPPDPAHDRQSALRIGSHTPPRPRRLPPRPLRLAWLPYVPRTALCPVVQLEVAWLASIDANAVRSAGCPGYFPRLRNSG